MVVYVNTTHLTWVPHGKLNAVNIDNWTFVANVMEYTLLSKDELKAHCGHRIECVSYAFDYEYDGDAQNVSLECVTCGEVLLSFDYPKEEIT
jgi:hypothetical protein